MNYLKNYLKIRKEQYDYHRTCKWSRDWNLKSPYTYFKSRLYMEGASILTFILQYTPISPNSITLLYLLLGGSVGLLLMLPYTWAVLTAVWIMFFKGILDLTDGHLARLKHKETDFGAFLDTFAGKVGTWSFYFGLIIYLMRCLYFEHRISFAIYGLFLVGIMGFLKQRKYIISGRASSIDLICFFILLDFT